MKCLKVFFSGLIFGVLFLSVQIASAQCAMCSTTVETNAKNGGSISNGLNHGVFVLLSAPYIAVAVVGYIWYKKYRRKNVNLDMRNEKLHLN